MFLFNFLKNNILKIKEEKNVENFQTLINENIQYL
jgi:hypothetical protein